MADSGYDIVKRQVGNDNRVTQRSVLSTQVTTHLLADGSVTDAKIANLSFDKAIGGTLTLGGSNNVNGTMSIKDSTGTEKITADNTGITINDGKITIKNSYAQTTIDSLGIVSNSNNFVQTGSTAAGLNQTINPSADTDITGSSLTFPLTRTTQILVLAMVTAYNTESVGNTGNSTIHIKSDGSDIEDINLFSGNTTSRTYSNFRITSLAVGSHTLKLTADIQATAGAPSLTIYDFRLSYLLLGT